MVAVILAGGKGTRLLSVTNDEVPKPLAKIAGKPILERCLMQLKKYGINEVYLTLGHLHEKIEEFLISKKNFGLKVHYIIEKEPLGSGGALYYLKDKIKDDFIVCSGDIIFDFDISKLITFHKNNKALITLVTHPNTHPYDSDIIVEKNGKVIEISKKNSKRETFYKNLVNAGFLIANPKTLSSFTELKKLNLEHDFVNNFIPTNKVYSYKTPEFIKDVGTEERFYETAKFLENGLVQSRNLRKKQKAIFLDRDGTINKYKGFINSSDDIELIDKVAEGIKNINQSGYLAIVISNQPVIARGECTFDEVEAMFDKIEFLLGLEGAYIDARYYCPHHPHKGYEGEVPELKIKCRCRKPDIGMIEKAVKDFNLDLKNCYIIGDSNVDIMTGKNANIKTIKVNSPLVEEPLAVPDYEAKDFCDAVEFILRSENEKKHNCNH